MTIMDDFNDDRHGSEWIWLEDDRRSVEENARRILSLYPEAKVRRCRDVIEIEIEGERGIVVLVTPEAFEIRMPTTEWLGGVCDPAPSSRFWKRVSADKLTEDDLARLLDRALKARQREFKRCRYCGESVPPEHRISDDVCHGCASRYEGVVF